MDGMIEVTQSINYLNQDQFDEVTTHFFDSLMFIHKDCYKKTHAGNIINASHNFVYLWSVDKDQTKGFKKMIETHFNKYYKFIQKENEEK